ncbi:MAG: hypothetical protein NDI94_01070 [Candidatus Woesearchaeota archaeon]|nr:hypothetical protein [Candidatus Woesearchaeota archaeon]
MVQVMDVTVDLIDLIENGQPKQAWKNLDVGSEYYLTNIASLGDSEKFAMCRDVGDAFITALLGAEHSSNFDRAVEIYRRALYNAAQAGISILALEDGLETRLLSIRHPKLKEEKQVESLIILNKDAVILQGMTDSTIASRFANRLIYAGYAGFETFGSALDYIEANAEKKDSLLYEGLANIALGIAREYDSVDFRRLDFRNARSYEHDCHDIAKSYMDIAAAFIKKAISLSGDRLADSKRYIDMTSGIDNPQMRWVRAEMMIAGYDASERKADLLKEIESEYKALIRGLLMPKNYSDQEFNPLPQNAIIAKLELLGLHFLIESGLPVTQLRENLVARGYHGEDRAYTTEIIHKVGKFLQANDSPSLKRDLGELYELYDTRIRYLGQSRQNQDIISHCRHVKLDIFGYLHPESR